MLDMENNPHSLELRYTLSLLAYQVQAIRPERVRIATQSPEMAKAMARQLSYAPISLFVDHAGIQQDILEALGLKVFLTESDPVPADVVVFPFSFGVNASPHGEASIVMACENAFSYKSLLYPRQIMGIRHRQWRRLGKEYVLDPVANLYSPRFIFWWTLAKAFETINSAWYFRLEDHAMRRLIDVGPHWRFSFLAVIIGRRAS